MSALEIVAVIGIVAYVIGRQLLGEKLAGKRLILLPAVLVLVGAGDLAGHGNHPGTTDIVMFVVEAVVAAAFGIAQGRMMYLEERDGVLWGKMPRISLWLWLGFVVSRVLLDLVASGLDAHVAASTAPILFTLGINRLAQAAVVAPRALAAGIPFAPERDGTTFLAGVFGQGQSHPGVASSSGRSSVNGGDQAAGERTGRGLGRPSSIAAVAEQLGRSRGRSGGFIGQSQPGPRPVPSSEQSSVAETELVAGDLTVRGAGWQSNLSVIAEQLVLSRRSGHGRSRAQDRRSARRRR